MTVWIALLRGINVGGRNALKMQELVRILEQAGLKNVRTYIQSGNAVFDSAAKTAPPLAAKIRKAIAGATAINPQIFVLSAADLASAAADNPFPEAATEPASLHLGFLDDGHHADRAALDKMLAASERYAIKGNVFYLHAPDGIGRSKLAAGMEKALATASTGRNWRTVQKLLEMAGGKR